MFDIEVFDNKAVFLHEYTVKADFFVPVKKPMAFYVDDIKPSPVFEKENFYFTYKFSLSYEMLMDLQPSSIVGYMLRNEFLKTFEPMKSNDAIQRAMKHMSDVMKDDGFTLGLLHGTTVSSHVSYQQMKEMLKFKSPSNHATGGYLDIGYTAGGAKIDWGNLINTPMRNEFSERAESFSRKDVFFQKVKHPVNGEVHALRSVIMNLNDFHKWPREEIADWIETLDININMKPKEAANG